MHDLVSEVAVAHLAENAHAPARRQRPLLVRVEVEEAKHQLRAPATVVTAVFEQADELPARPILDIGVEHRPFGLLQQAAPERSERDDARVVLVAQRQVEHQILVAYEAEACELVGKPARLRPIGRLRLVRRGLRRRDQIGNGGFAARDVTP
jgi:hypothetical protein